MDSKQVSPPLMAHRTRVDRMTHHDNECNEAWDREWTASPTYERVCHCHAPPGLLPCPCHALSRTA
jgi:hypothetical protein